MDYAFLVWQHETEVLHSLNACPPVIPLVESNAMVIDRSSSVDCERSVSIPLVFVELKLQGFHASHDRRNG